jgi:hypothetical protein
MMTFRIEHSSSVADIQHAFSLEYPYLKIEFFEPCHRSVPPRKRKGVSGETALGNIGKILIPADLEFDDETSVAELEEKFQEMFGISAQVYRRAGNIWIETNITDKWTLKHQNEQGRQLSIHNTKSLDDIMRQRREEGALNRDVVE